MGEAARNGSGLRWTGEVGVGSILGFCQLVAFMAGGVWMYAKLDSTANNTKDTTIELRHIVDRQQERQQGINDRLIKIETVVSAITDTIRNIDSKLDARPQSPR